MNTSTVSAKYQIVIPKALRGKLDLKPGQKVYLASTKTGEITVKTASQVGKLYGSMQGAWDKGGDAHVRRLRAEAERDRA